MLKVSYNKLWKLIIDKEMSKAQLRKRTGIAASTFSKMNKSECVSLEIIVKLCHVLDCDIGDVVGVLRVGIEPTQLLTPRGNSADE